MLEYTINEKAAIINVLSLIMEADNVLHPNEIAFMDKIMKDMKITVSDLDHMEVSDFNISRSIIGDMSPGKKQEVKRIFNDMASVDGVVDPRELDIINAL